MTVAAHEQRALVDRLMSVCEGAYSPGSLSTSYTHRRVHSILRYRLAAPDRSISGWQ